MKLWIDDVRPAPEGYLWCKYERRQDKMKNHFSDEVIYFLACCGISFIIEHLIAIGVIIGMGVS